MYFWKSNFENVFVKGAIFKKYFLKIDTLKMYFLRGQFWKTKGWLWKKKLKNKWKKNEKKFFKKENWKIGREILIEMSVFKF